MTIAYCRLPRSDGGDNAEICYMIETPKTILHVQKQRSTMSDYDKNSLLLQNKAGFTWTYHN